MAAPVGSAPVLYNPLLKVYLISEVSVPMAIDTQSILAGSFKYVYLIVFFTFLAGFFHPLITNTSFDGVIIGVLILLIGLAGGILLFKSATYSGKKGLLLGAGLGLMALSTVGIYYMAGIL